MAAVDRPADVRAPLVVGVVAESCAACGVKLAADQRYCVDCGQPRGAPRLPTTRAPAVQVPDRPRGRGSANTALIAGIGTLLLAMGVGVLIGSQGRSDTSAPAKVAPQTVTVITQGSGAATSAAGTPAAAAAAQTPRSSAATSPAKKAAPTAAAPPTVKKATPPVVHLGSPGTGPGYQNGKFTGNFF